MRRGSATAEQVGDGDVGERCRPPSREPATSLTAGRGAPAAPPENCPRAGPRRPTGSATPLVPAARRLQQGRPCRTPPRSRARRAGPGRPHEPASPEGSTSSARLSRRLGGDSRGRRSGRCRRARASLGLWPQARHADHVVELLRSRARRRGARRGTVDQDGPHVEAEARRQRGEQRVLVLAVAVAVREHLGAGRGCIRPIPKLTFR